MGRGSGYETGRFCEKKTYGFVILGKDGMETYGQSRVGASISGLFRLCPIHAWEIEVFSWDGENAEEKDHLASIYWRWARDSGKNFRSLLLKLAIFFPHLVLV
ncbi:MAG: hypothetical protein NPIRA06_08180 [Nitrospirales bacterium]|nr:MAG: hypothetical protein NPIRA06_08180 [Nitrospirales bacterium]